MKFNLINNWAISIEDFDIKESSIEDAHKIAKLLLSNMVVVLRNQCLSPSDELNFCNLIGNVTPTNSERGKHLSVTNGILRVTGQKNQHGEEGLFGHTSALDWHANQASNPNRKPLIWLYGVKDTEGSITSWINNIESYKKIPQDIKDEIQNLEITLGYKKGKYSNSDFFKEHHHVDNPFRLVYTNDAGQTGLYFPFLQIFGIKGYTKDNFDTLMERLTTHILKEEFRYDHYWRDGDVVLSEQWLSIHKRWKFNGMDRRILHRIAFDYAKVDL